MCEQLRIRIFLSGLLWCLMSLTGSAEPSVKPLYQHWEVVARADLVAKAKLHVPIEALRESIRAKKKNDFIKLRADVVEPAKGHFPSQPVLVRYYTGPSESLPSASFLEEHNGDEVVLFLRELAGEDSFADRSPHSAVPFSNDEFSKIAAEVKNQEEIVQTFDQLSVGKATPTDTKVGELLEGLARKQTQEAAWAQLLKLGRQDVPAIVRAMNHHKSVPPFDAYVPNLASDAFEKYRHRSAGSVGDAASILLEHITGESFDMNGWRVWCAYNF